MEKNCKFQSNSQVWLKIQHLAMLQSNPADVWSGVGVCAAVRFLSSHLSLFPWRPCCTGPPLCHNLCVFAQAAACPTARSVICLCCFAPRHSSARARHDLLRIWTTAENSNSTADSATDQRQQIRGFRSDHALLQDGQISQDFSPFGRFYSSSMFWHNFSRATHTKPSDKIHICCWRV